MTFSNKITINYELFTVKKPAPRYLRIIGNELPCAFVIFYSSNLVNSVINMPSIIITTLDGWKNSDQKLK